MPKAKRSPDVGMDISGDLVNPARMGKGPMDRMVEFAKPLIEAAGNDPKAVKKAFTFGMIFWNLAVCGKDFVVEELPKIEKGLCKSDKDRLYFRAMAGMMLERYQAMRPNSPADLVPALREVWGKDLSAGIGDAGWLGSVVNKIRGALKREPEHEAA